MFNVFRLIARLLLTVGITAGVLAGAVLSSTASASGPYTVTVKVVPSNVPLNGHFTVTASGASANLSRLFVYLNPTKPCAITAAIDATLPGDTLIINPPIGVVHAYSKSATATAKVAGTHHACAYLRATAPSTLPRARASAPYTVA